MGEGKKMRKMETRRWREVNRENESGKEERRHEARTAVLSVDRI